MLGAWPERVHLLPWLLPLLSASWLPGDEQLSSGRSFHNALSAWESANYRLNLLKVRAPVSLTFKLWVLGVVFNE